MKPKEYTQPIKDGTNWYIYQLEEVVPERYKPYDDKDVQVYIENNIKDFLYTKSTEELVKKADIKYNDVEIKKLLNIE